MGGRTFSPYRKNEACVNVVGIFAHLLPTLFTNLEHAQTFEARRLRAILSFIRHTTSIIMCSQTEGTKPSLLRISQPLLEPNKGRGSSMKSRSKPRRVAVTVLLLVVLWWLTATEAPFGATYELAIQTVWKGSFMPPRTAFIYIASTYEPHIQEVVSELGHTLGDNFRLVWDNKRHKQCPYHDGEDGVYLQHPCIDQWNISQTNKGPHKLSHKGRGQEKAITWAMDHRDQFDYVWFMESDVHYSDLDTLRRVMNDREYWTADVVNQEEFFPVNDWFYQNETKYGMARWLPVEYVDANPDVHVHAMMNLYRVSNKFLDKLAYAYEKMEHEWVFFEALFPTLSVYYNLTWARYHRPQYSMVHRPCKTDFSEPGIYHPVKFRNGTVPVPCECWEWSFKWEMCVNDPNFKGCDNCKKNYWENGLVHLPYDRSGL